jgi:hypothetical protein
LGSPSFEFRLHLLEPSICLGSEDKLLTLSIVTVNFIHNVQDGLVGRSLEVREVLLQTQLSKRDKRSLDCSLIRPWNLTASMNICNGKNECKCKTHKYTVEADILNGRAAFSDLVVAIDLALQYLDEVKESHQKSFQKSAQSTETSKCEDTNECNFDGNFPVCTMFDVKWHGLRLVVADDTGRHFVGEQDLVVLFIQGIVLRRQEKRATLKTAKDESNELKLIAQYSIELSLNAVDILDCLQSDLSPFRRVLAMRPLPESNKAIDSCTGSCEGCSKDISIAGDAVKLWSLISENTSYGADFRSIEIQYNPSMVVALQRFLGRLLKDVRSKHCDLLRKSSSPSRDKAPSKVSEGNVDVQGEIHFDNIFLCLNKEHQGRRLLESTLTNLSFGFERSTQGYHASGHLSALIATDPSCSSDLARKVIRSSQQVGHFLTFQYKTFASRVLHYNDLFPTWILSQIGHDGRIDDFIEISVAAVDFVFLRDRTEELVDYLSNGMPGKGMGATSRAAKGFVNDRIQKRSFFCVHVDSPNIIVPGNKDYACRFSLRLGKFTQHKYLYFR